MGQKNQGFVIMCVQNQGFVIMCVQNEKFYTMGVFYFTLGHGFMITILLYLT